MKHLFTFLFFFFIFTSCFGQFDKLVTFQAKANFNIALNGLATNDAGIGVGFDASFFSKSRLQAIIEASADRFFGDKLLIIDPVSGKEGKSAAVYSIKAGPQFFITKNLAAATAYGPAWHVVRDVDYSLDFGFTHSLTCFFGRERRFVAKVFLVDIQADVRRVQYLGVAAGLRF